MVSFFGDEVVHLSNSQNNKEDVSNMKSVEKDIEFLNKKMMKFEEMLEKLLERTEVNLSSSPDNTKRTQFSDSNSTTTFSTDSRVNPKSNYEKKIHYKLIKLKNYENHISNFRSHLSNNTLPASLFHCRFPKPFLLHDDDLIKEHNQIIKETQTKFIDLNLKYLEKRIDEYKNDISTFKNTSLADHTFNDEHEVDAFVRSIQTEVEEKRKIAFARSHEKLMKLSQKVSKDGRNVNSEYVAKNKSDFDDNTSQSSVSSFSSFSSRRSNDSVKSRTQPSYNSKRNQPNHLNNTSMINFRNKDELDNFVKKNYLNNNKNSNQNYTNRYSNKNNYNSNFNNHYQNFQRNRNQNHTMTTYPNNNDNYTNDKPYMNSNHNQLRARSNSRNNINDFNSNKNFH